MYPLIIGIAGGSGCGKTTVARNICQELKGKRAIIIPQGGLNKVAIDIIASKMNSENRSVQRKCC